MHGRGKDAAGPELESVAYIDDECAFYVGYFFPCIRGGGGGGGSEHLEPGAAWTRGEQGDGAVVGVGGGSYVLLSFQSAIV